MLTTCTRVSTYCIFYIPNLIAWSSKKRRGVSRSSTESEYRQLAYMVAVILWLPYLFDDLRLPFSLLAIWCEKMSANLVFCTRPLHVEVDYHHIRENATCKALDVRYVCSSDKIADLF